MQNKLVVIIGVIFIVLSGLLGLGINKLTTHDYESVSYKVLLSQLNNTHMSEAYSEGFLKALESKGLHEGVNIQMEFVDICSYITSNEKSKKILERDQIDLFITYGVEDTLAAYRKVVDIGIPMIFSMSAEPISIGMHMEADEFVDEVTGITLKINRHELLGIIHDILPNASKVGILYGVGNDDCMEALEEYKVLVKEFGLELVPLEVHHGEIINEEIVKMLDNVDCIIDLNTDFVEVEFSTLIDLAVESNTPVFSEIIEHVKFGCVAANGIDYYELGYEVGIMAAEILTGQLLASDIPLKLMNESSLSINKPLLDKLEIDLNKTIIKEADIMFDTVE